MNSTHRAFVRAALALSLTAAAAATAGASAPALMTYQGRVKESGLPVTATRSVDVYLCPDAAVALASCFDTGAQNVSVVNGLFRTTFTVPSGAAWETGTWYLQVSVNGSLFTPREQVTSGAYAVYASSAATLIANPGDPAVFIAPNVAVAGDGFSVGGSTLVVKGGLVGIGTSSPATALHVNGSLTLDGAGHLRATGAGASVPALGSGCGGGSIAGGDTAGRVTIGASVATADCQIVFGTPWTTNAPVCHFTNESGSSQAYTVSAADVFSVTFHGPGSFVNGDVISYLCVGY